MSNIRGLNTDENIDLYIIANILLILCCFTSSWINSNTWIKYHWSFNYVNTYYPLNQSSINWYQYWLYYQLVSRLVITYHPGINIGCYILPSSAGSGKIYIIADTTGCKRDNQNSKLFTLFISNLSYSTSTWRLLYVDSYLHKLSQIWQIIPLIFRISSASLFHKNVAFTLNG